MFLVWQGRLTPASDQPSHGERMTPRVRRLFLVIAATACGSENPNVGYETVSTDSYQEVPGCGDGECSGQRCGDGECSGQGPVIELRDHRPDGTRADCDAGPIRSPGADIDSAELTKADGTSGIYLTSCTLSGNACESDNAAPANAEGASDAPAKEVLDLYTSLDGGTLSCFWAGGGSSRVGRHHHGGRSRRPHGRGRRPLHAAPVPSQWSRLHA